MKKIIKLIFLVIIITSCDPGKRTTDEIFVGLWKCNSVVGTDDNGDDLGVSNYLTKCDGTIRKVENTEEGYYFFHCDNRYTLAKGNDSTLSGDGCTLTYNERNQKLIAKTSNYIAISATTLHWVYEFNKQK